MITVVCYYDLQIFFFLKTGSQVAQAILELPNLLPLPPRCQSYAVKPCLGDEWWAWDPEGCGSGSFRLTRKEL